MNLRDFRHGKSFSPEANANKRNLDQESLVSLRSTRQSVLLANSLGNQPHLRLAQEQNVRLSRLPPHARRTSIELLATNTNSSPFSSWMSNFSPMVTACSSPYKPETSFSTDTTNNNENNNDFYCDDLNTENDYATINDRSSHQTPIELDSRPSSPSNQSAKSEGRIRPPAVNVHEVSLSYGSGRQKLYCLRHLCMQVKMGCIYALLGPSGCGKTTLLKIILGQKKPTTGYVRLFGYRSGDRKSGVPGNGVGYMPQEIALCNDLSIREMLSYFGSVGFMNKQQIKKRIKELHDELNLPSLDQVIDLLSGGQRRRVSLAVALMLRSRLLILDEPTVGVDPLLRAHIWDMLKSRADQGCTILITTHYVEEAKGANTVGFLRQGRLLAEGPPLELQRRLNCITLEHVFYRLCLQNTALKNAMIADDVALSTGLIDDASKMATLPTNPELLAGFEHERDTVKLKTVDSVENAQNEWNLATERRLQEQQQQDLIIEKVPHIEQCNLSPLRCWMRRLGAVTANCWMLSLRRPGTIIAQYLLPIITTMLFCVCIGSTPNGIRLGILSEESCPNSQQLLLVRQLTTGFNESDSPHPLAALPDFIKRIANHVQSHLSQEIKERWKRNAEFNETDFGILTTGTFNHTNTNPISLNENETFHDISTVATTPESPSSLQSESSTTPRITTTEKSDLSDILTTYFPSTTSVEGTSNTTSNTVNTVTTTASTTTTNTVNIITTTESITTAKPINNDHLEIDVETSTLDTTDDDSTEPPPILYTEFKDACFAELFFQHLDSFVFELHRVSSQDEALRLTREGKLWGFLHIKSDFSRATLARLFFADHNADINLADAKMIIRADLTNRVLVDTVQRSVRQSYLRFINKALQRANWIHHNATLNSDEFSHLPDHRSGNDDILTGSPWSSAEPDFEKRFNPNASRLPIEQQESVFGSDVEVSDFFGVRDFAAPGVLTVVAYSISFALTAFDLVIELEDYMLPRHLIAGVSNLQFVLGHCAARLPFTCTSGPLLLLLCVYTFEIPCRGSFIVSALLLTLQSICGMCQALLVSALCPNAAVCAAVSNGILVLVFIISGVFWSVETLPMPLQWFSRIQPTSIPCESLRALLARGLTISEPLIQLGFQITAAWCVFYFLAAVYVFHRRTKA